VTRRIQVCESTCFMVFLRNKQATCWPGSIRRSTRRSCRWPGQAGSWPRRSWRQGGRSERPSSPSARRKSRWLEPQVALAQYRLDCTTVRAPINASSWRNGQIVGTRLDESRAGVRESVRHGRRARDGGRGLDPGARLAKIAKGGAAVRDPGRCPPNEDYRGRVARVQPVAAALAAPWRFGVRWKLPRRTSGFGRS